MKKDLRWINNQNDIGKTIKLIRHLCGLVLGKDLKPQKHKTAR